MATRASGGAQPSFPDDGAVTDPSWNGTETDGASCWPTDDGVLWFRPIRPWAGGFSTELIGNVAEYAAEYGEGAAALRGDIGPVPSVPLAREVVLSTLRSSMEVGVIGASALSPVAFEPGEVQTPRRITSAGFTDVGFRLAFTGGGSPSALRRLQALLGEAPISFVAR